MHATSYKIPLNIAFAAGNQLYNVPQSYIGLAFHKSNTYIATLLFCFANFSFTAVKGTISTKWLHRAE
jgi:hypothetical protein